MIKTIYNKIKTIFQKAKNKRKTSYDPDVVPKFELLDVEESAHLVTNGFKILDGPFAGVVFCVLKIIPRETPDKEHLTIAFHFEVIEAPIPAEQLEQSPTFQHTVQLIITKILEDKQFEINTANNSWVADNE